MNQNWREVPGTARRWMASTHCSVGGSLMGDALLSEARGARCEILGLSGPQAAEALEFDASGWRFSEGRA